MASSKRRIRFLMDRRIYDKPMWNWLFRLMGAIPISEQDSPREILHSIKAARRSMEAGNLVCLFAEGTISNVGSLLGFKRGLERIVRGTDLRVVPVYLHGLFGSRFSSWTRERLFGRLGLTVSFGRSMPQGSSAFQVRQKVMEMAADVHILDKEKFNPLPLDFVKTARANWRKPCLFDSTGVEMTYGAALSESLALSGVLEKHTKGKGMVGILLPTTSAAACANLAVSFLDKIPVNLNYTASAKAMDSAIRQCGADTIITSRMFIGKIGFENLDGLIYIEDLQKEIGFFHRALSQLKARFCPLRMFGIKSGIDRTAAVIFSSGSTGEPKGIKLSHSNIRSNIESMHKAFRLKDSDVFCGVLPFFHSFGYTVTFWLPLILGLGSAFHSNPLEAKKVGRLVEKRRCSFLVSTPTFLQAYIRRVEPAQFASLRMVVSGAEKLDRSLAVAFEKKFNIQPLQGYGATELAPVACVNIPSFGSGDAMQLGCREGCIGRPLPGVAVKVVDPENHKIELAPDQEGLLLVKGQNVMKGYLANDDETRKVLHDGWYVTGDMGAVDIDGFVKITDRLSRFSKVGGEMAPHIAVEDALHKGLDPTIKAFAVTSVPDKKKGEKLVVLHTKEGGDPKAAVSRLKKGGLPNLWIPSINYFIKVKEIPLLGSGKLDLFKLKSIAKKAVC